MWSSAAPAARSRPRLRFQKKHTHYKEIPQQKVSKQPPPMTETTRTKENKQIETIQKRHQRKPENDSNIYSKAVQSKHDPGAVPETLPITKSPTSCFLVPSGYQATKNDPQQNPAIMNKTLLFFSNKKKSSPKLFSLVFLTTRKSQTLELY